MAATFVAAANDPTSGDSQAFSRSVSKPLNASAGHLAAFFLTAWTGTGDPTVTPPSGSVLRSDTSNGTERTWIYFRFVETLDTSYTFSFSTSTWSTLHAQFFSDIDPNLDLATVPFNSATAPPPGNGKNAADTTVTTVAGAALAWCVNTQDYTGATTHTPPTGYTETGDLSGSSAAYQIAAAGGDQIASGATIDPGVDSLSTLVALAPVPAGGVDILGAASLTATSSLSSTAGLDVPAASTLTSASSLTTTAQLDVPAVSTLSAASSLTATGSLDVNAAAALIAESTLSAATPATGDVVGASSLTAETSLTATGRVGATGAVTFASAGDLTATGRLDVNSATVLTGESAITAAVFDGSWFGTAALAAASALTASGQVDANGIALFTAATQLLASTHLDVNASVAFTAESALSVAPPMTPGRMVMLPPLEQDMTRAEPTAASMSWTEPDAVSMTGLTRTATTMRGDTSHV